ncbi:hypothetical protein ABZ897_36610 [Nonomuraea sp. NPDC046802]|uniref:WD40 repeat domain-containing protein n=1 Tax=Nonomuraea sp. NPDC046802 TaxID=3154919 RepID=UPI0033FF1E49
MHVNGGEVEKLAARMATGGRRRQRRAARQLARTRSPKAVRALATAYASPGTDPRVVSIAESVLAGLDDPAGVDAVCEVLIATGAERLSALVSTTGYRHSDPVRHAVLLFLIGDFEQYAELDFDGGMLAAVHAAADAELRSRLAARARVAGRMEWVRAVSGAQRRGELSDPEWEAVVATLTVTGRWDELWRLACEAPPVWGARMLRELAGQPWWPQSKVERAAFDKLAGLARACSEDLTRGHVAVKSAVLGTHLSSLSCLVVMPGELLASVSFSNEVRWWHLPSGDPAGVLRAPKRGVRCMAVTPDGTLLVTGDDGGRVRSWHLPSGKPAGTLRGHKYGVRCLAVTPDGTLLVTGDDGGTVRLWHLPSGESARVLTGHKRAVRCLAMAPDGTWFASGGDDGTVRLWHLQARAAIRTPVAQIDMANVERMRFTVKGDPERAWARLIRELVRRLHQYDIAVDTAGTAAFLSPTDIELDR